MDVSCHRPFLPGNSLEPAVLATTQASSFTLQYFPYCVQCSKYSCFCSESIECFLGISSKFFLKLLVTIPVAPIITGIIVHFRFHIRLSLYINSCILISFPLPFAKDFCLRVLPHLSVCIFSLFCF